MNMGDYVMKKAIMVVLALSLVLSVVPAMAGTSSQAPALQAMSQLSTVAPMTDQQLASVEGAFVFFNFQRNVAVIHQTIAFSNCGVVAALNCNQSATVIQVNSAH
jgi:hypothetical protein